MNSEKDFYNQRYSVKEGYAAKADDLAPYHIEVLNILKGLDIDKGDKVVVDAGCGRGVFEEIFTSIINIDLSKEAVCSLKNKGIAGDLCNLPIKKGSVDILVSVTALEHVPHPELALLEFDRILKKGGVVILRPAYFCRWWSCRKLGKKPFKILDFIERLLWVVTKIEEFRPLFLAKWMLRRIYREIERLFSSKPTRLMYYKLSPNYHTFENIKKAIFMMKENNFKTALLVTSDTHMYRAIHIAKKDGFNFTPAHAPNYSKYMVSSMDRLVLFYKTTWEFVGIEIYRVTGWI